MPQQSTGRKRERAMLAAQMDRLMLELMARGGMRIGEVLKLRQKDVQDRKLNLQEPKAVKRSKSFTYRER